MITREEALTRARSWTADLGSENPPEVSLHEFSLGWVAWPMPTTPQDPTQASFPANRPQIVIDRETGDLTHWPPIPVSDIAEKYIALKALGDRFPPDVRMMLEDAGWFPGRDISLAVDQWEISFAEELAGMTFYPAARAAMCEFGALSIAQVGPADGGYRSHIFPTRGGVGVDAAHGFVEEYEHPVFPLGINQDGPAELVMDEQGRVFFLHWADEFYLGANIDAALILLVRGGDWPDVFSRTWQNDAGVDQASVGLKE